MSFEIEWFTCTNKQWKMCNRPCVCVWCGEKERGAGVWSRVEGNKDAYERLGLPQRACDSHNHVQYHYTIVVFTKLRRLQGILVDTFHLTITLAPLMFIVLVFSVGAHHSMVHRLPLSHPGFIPCLFCGKGVKWWVWDLCWCSLVGTGKTKLKKHNKTWVVSINITIFQNSVML